ncbi:MAG: FAD-binding oxidoreductase [bacterium]|nr:FAD-binding oxidoreductase [bacterium]
MTLAEELRKVVKGEVLDDQKTRDAYSRDYSIFEIEPQVVVFPKDTEDVQALVRFASEKKKAGEDVSLTGRSGGTDMTGGPLSRSVVVEFDKHLNRIKEVTESHAVVEPGVYFRDFEKELTKRGLMYPAYPASKDICALGGMIANNSGGEKTLAYGKTEDYVEELKVVLADGKEHILRPLSGEALKAKLAENGFEGELYRKLHALVEKHYDAIWRAKPNVSKNSAGYALWNVWDRKTFNMAKLIVGSQGTLGLVTEAKLRLVKRKRYERLIAVFAKDLHIVPELVRAILPFSPESIESYDDKTLRLAVRFFPALIRLMKGSVIKLGWQFLPEFFMLLRGGFPRIVLLIELASDDGRELAERMRALGTTLEKFSVQVRLTKSEAEAEKYWTIRRQSFKLLHDYAKDKEAAPFVDDFIVRPEHMPELLPQVNAILDRYKDKLTYTIAGHPGDGNFHIIPLVDLKDPEVRAIIPKVMEEVYGLVLRYKGSTTAEHNDGLIRGSFLKQMYGEEVYGLFEELKKMFDPLNIFNPGKKIGVDLKAALEHLKK